MYVHRLIVVVAINGLVFVSVLLLFVLAYGGFGHAWNRAFDGSSITYYNTTDEVLCYGYPPSGCLEIKPNGTTRWGNEQCFSGGPTSVFTSRGRKLYEKVIECKTGVFIAINQRDGEFVVADNVLSP